MEPVPEFLKTIETKALRLKSAAFKTKQQPMSPFGYQYTGFQRRMMAAAIDSAVMVFTIIPLSFFLTDLLVGKVVFDFNQLAMQLQSVPDPLLKKQMTSDYLHSGGRMNYFMVNSLIQTILMFVYCMVSWKYWGATPGKMLMRLKVVRFSDGQNLGYMQGFWRCVGYVVTAGMGVVSALFDKKNQGLHDKMAGSVVLMGLSFRTMPKLPEVLVPDVPEVVDAK